MENKNKKENVHIWCDFINDNVAGVRTFNQCIALGDLMSDGDNRLIIADLNCNLKVFNGNILQNDTKLQFSPIAIAFFHSLDANTKNLIPYLAIAGGSYIFIYKNLKGTFKFSIPNIEPNAQEVQIWNELKEDKLDHSFVISKLQEMYFNKIELSTRSLELLSIGNTASQIKYIDERKNVPITISNWVVCMTTLKKNSIDENIFNSYIVVGTECGIIYIIDHSSNKILNKIKIPSNPFKIIAMGAYDIDYRLQILSRENIIYTIKNGEIQNPTIELHKKAVGIVRTEKSIIVGTINSMIDAYQPSGKKNFSIKLPAHILCIESLEIKSSVKSFKGYIISIKNGEIRTYNEKILIHLLKLSENISAMKFGRFSNEENCLIMISETGSLIIKTLMKNVVLETISYNTKNIVNDDLPLSIPKKTKLYLDLLEREKDMATNMHFIFQNDLLKLRYKTLDTYAKLLKIGNAPQNYNTSSNIKLSASLLGLGPFFKLNITVENGGDEIISGADLILEYDKLIFMFEKEYIQLGLLMPNIPCMYYLKFKNISESGNSGNVKILIVDKLKTAPLTTTTLKVPISELELL